MKKTTIKKLKAGMCIAVIAGVIAPLPLISAQASAKRAYATKSALAVDFVKTENLAAPKLQSLSADIHSLPVAIRDAALISDIPTLDVNLMSAAENANAQTKCMAQAIYYEARSETLSGQKAVGEVVLNRVASKHYPYSVCGVVFQGFSRATGCQFSFTCDGSMGIAPKGKAWERSQLLAEHMMIGAHKPMTAKATHYHTTNVNPKWAGSVQPTRQIGSHKFYRFKTRREQAMARAVAP